MTKTGFVLTDKNNETYRVFANNFAEAINKVTSEHGISESDIQSITSGKTISPLNLD